MPAFAPITLGDIGTLITTLLLVLTWLDNRRNKQNIQKIEIATNSMKDALVASTDKAARATGREEGRLVGQKEERAQKGLQP